MSAPAYTASDLANLFGDNYSGSSPGVLLPLNALHSCAEEIGVLSLAANEQHVDFEIVLFRLGRRMELAAEIGHKEIMVLLARVAELEAKLESTVKAGAS